MDETQTTHTDADEAVSDPLHISTLKHKCQLTQIQNQEWHDLLEDVRHNYILTFTMPLNGDEDEWRYWQKCYGPGILDPHHQRTATEISNFLDFLQCDSALSTLIGEIVSIHDCGKTDRSQFTPEDWVQHQRPDKALRAKRRLHTERGKKVFAEVLQNRRALACNDTFCALVEQILSQHHDSQSPDPLIRAVAIVDAYDGDTQHHWPHQGKAPRDAMTEFRRLLGIDADGKYAGKTDTDLVLRYAAYKKTQGVDVSPEQLERELADNRGKAGAPAAERAAPSLSK